MAAQAKPIFVRLIVDEAIELRSRCPLCTRSIGAADIPGQITTHKLNNHVLYEIPPGAVTVEDVMVALQEELTILRGFQIFLDKFVLLSSVNVKVFELNQGVFSIKLLPDCDEPYAEDSMLACSSRRFLTFTPIRHSITNTSVDTMDISGMNFADDEHSLTTESSTKSAIPSSMPGENFDEIKSSSNNTNLNDVNNEKSSRVKEACLVTGLEEKDILMVADNLVKADDNSLNESQIPNTTPCASASTGHGATATAAYSSGEAITDSIVQSTADVVRTSSDGESLGVLLSPLLSFKICQPTSNLVSSDVETSENRSEIVVSAENITSKKRTLLDADADSMPSASMINDATPLLSISNPKKKPKLVSFEVKSNYSDSDGKKVKGTDEKTVIIGTERQMSWKELHPLSTLDRENVPHASCLHFLYIMKGESSGQGDQVLPVLMVFDSFIWTPDGDAIRGAVVEDNDDASINYGMQVFMVKNIRSLFIYK